VPLVQKGNSGQIHNGRFCHQVCAHSLHTSGIQDLGEPHDPSSPSNPFSNPDVPSEEIDDPGQDDDPSPGPDPSAEPIRVQRKERQISVDSTDALPKAKAKVIIKRANVQLPGHVQPMSVPTPKYDEEDEGPSHDPQASSSRITPFLCRGLHPHHLCQVSMRSKERQNWYSHKTMMKQNHTTLMRLLF
jgi:hypothetical protein